MGLKRREKEKEGEEESKDRGAPAWRRARRRVPSATVAATVHVCPKVHPPPLQNSPNASTVSVWRFLQRRQRTKKKDKA